jgi:hypothetical protein
MRKIKSAIILLVILAMALDIYFFAESQNEMETMIEMIRTAKHGENTASRIAYAYRLVQSQTTALYAMIFIVMSLFATTLIKVKK